MYNLRLTGLSTPNIYTAESNNTLPDCRSSHYRRNIVFTPETLIMVGAIVLCIGGLIGAVISRKFIPPEHQKELETNLQAAREDLKQYQQDVAQHFEETSRLVHNLTQSYKEVHEHLAKGAIHLTNSDISRQMLEAGDGNIGAEAGALLAETTVLPPRDWAPKTPGQKGTLSEEFGLLDEAEAENAEKPKEEKEIN